MLTEQEKQQAREVLNKTRQLSQKVAANPESSWEAFDKQANENIAKKQAIEQITKPKEQGFLNKVGSLVTEKIPGAFEKLGETFLYPTLRSLETIGAEPIRKIQEAVPGGATGKETLPTPFGEIKPISEMTGGEKAWTAIDVASVIPLGKLFGVATKGVGKVGEGILKYGGEFLTGVENTKLKKWFDLAKNSPEKIKEVKEIVEINPQEPFKGLGQKIVSKFNELKSQAQESWKTATDVFKKQSPDTTFDLSYKVPELKQPLEQFGLTLKQLRDKTGKLTRSFNVSPKGNITGFSDQEVGLIQGIVNDLKDAKNYSVDDLLALEDKFDSAYNSIKYGVDFKPKKYHALVMELKDEVSKFIDGVLPEELKNARSLYRDYYDAYKKIGNKVMDASGELKPGAETFLSNIMNLNKGVERQKVVEVGSKLGIDILDSADNLKTAKELSASIPNSTRNRTADVIRGIIGSKTFGGAAGAGAFINPSVGIPALILNIMSSPKVYSGLIEIIAGVSKKLPVEEAIKKLSPEEVVSIQQILKGLLPREE